MLTTLLNPKDRTSSFPKFGRDFLAVAFLPLLLCSLAPAAALSSQTQNKTTNPKIPADLMPVLENTLYSIKSDTSGVRRAENAANRFSVEFSGAQTIVHTGTAETAPATLRVDGYGWGSTLNPAGAVTQVQTAGKRLDRHYASGFSEWFENTRQGLEQGFVLEQRATAASGALHIRLAAEGGWSVKATGDAVQLTRGTTTLHYAGLKAWDANHAALPARLRAVGSAIEIEVDDANAVYPLTVDPTLYVQVAELTPYDAAAGEYLGVSVALSADGTTALVGAYSKASGKGYAYIFADNNGNWGQSKELTSSNTADGFGLSVALSADGTIALIGATDSPTTPAAYVFTHSAVYTWTQQNITDPSFPPNAVSSPVNVALSGDGSTALIGVPLASGGYVIAYTSSSGTFTQQGPSLYPVSGGTPISYGSALALSNNGNTALIGCAGYILNGLPARGGYPTGAGFLFTRTGTSWAQTGLLTASDGYKLGSAVALSGDGTTAVMTGQGSPSAAYVYTIPSASGTPVELLPSGGDGIGNISLSSDGNTLIGGSTALGSAYVFTRSGTTWTQAETLTASDGVSTDYFGYSVAISGDAGTLLVGAFGKNSSAGTAYVFTPASALTAQTITFPTIPNQIQGTSLSFIGITASASSGLEVSVTGNTPNVCTVTTNATGLNDLLNFVSAGTCSLTASQPGNSKYTAATPVTQTFTVAPDVNITPTSYSQQAEVAASDAAPGIDFGTSVALSANGNTALVGAYNYTSGKGHAYIFTRTAGTWTQQTEFTSPNTFDNFGASVALSADGTVALVGAVDSDTSPAAYVFTYSGGTWFRQPINNINVNGFLPGRPYSFPTFVALSGDGTTALIGEPSAHWNCGDGCGQFFVYTVSGPPKASLHVLYSAYPINLGASVALSYNGNTVLVGAPNYEGFILAEGAAFLYTYSGTTWTQTKLSAADVPANGAASDRFGTGVALSSDGTTAVVSGGNGVAYVFKYSGTTWTPQADLLPSDGGGIGNISLSSDGNTFVGSDTVTGSAYLFTRSGSTWSAGKLIASDEVSTDLFGNSVAISGDASTLLIGAYGKNLSAGAAYFFGLPATLAPQTITFNTIPSQLQGTSLPVLGSGIPSQAATASSGLAVTFTSNTTNVCTVTTSSNSVSAAFTAFNFIGTGTCSITASQPGNSTYAAATPVTQTFTVAPEIAITSTQYSQQSEVAASDTSSGNQFGVSVALSANGNTAVVGAYNQTSGKGYAYIFTRISGTWTQSAELTSPNTVDNFGDSVALSANGTVALVGAVDSNTSPAAYVFTYSGGSWSRQPINNLNVGSPYPGPVSFAVNVALSGDGSTALIGEPGVPSYDEGINGGGSFFLYTISGPQKSPLAGGAPDYPLFLGSSVALSYNGNTVLVGAPSTPFFQAGAAYVYTYSGTSWTGATLTAADVPSDSLSTDGLGTAAALSSDGTTAVVGAANGAAYVFEYSGTTWTQQTALLPSDGGRILRISLSSDGNTFIGSSRASGSAYLFTRSGTTWSAGKLIASDEVSTDLFGNSVAISGDASTLLIGAEGKNSSAGAAYFFGLPTTLTPQTITFNTIPTQTEGTTLTLTATASSNLAVTYVSNSNSVCTVNGSVASFIGTGSCSITASQTGNSTYAAATPVTQTFNVIAPVTTGGSNPGITGQTPGAVRNNYTGFVGMEFQVGATPITIYSLGRFIAPGNSQVHLVKLVQANGTDVPAGSVSINTATGTSGTYEYAALASPITLLANTTYFLVSMETAGGDYWHDLGPVTPASSITVLAPTYTDGGGHYVPVSNLAGESYVPVNFLTGTATTPTGLSVNITSPVSAATISGVTPVTVATTGAVTSLQIQVDGANIGSPVAASGSSDTLSLNTAQLTNGAHTLVVVASDAASDTVNSAGVSVTVANTSGTSTSFVTAEKPGPARNNYTGFVGMNFTVGSSPVVVNSLGRFVLSGNTDTHVVKLVQANGTNVPGGSVTVATAGVTPGTFAYGTLAAPVTLQAGTSYYLLSQEAFNGDQWYDIGAVTTTSVASVTGPVYTDGNGNPVTVAGLPGNSYVPVSFTYGGSGTTPPAISATITSPSTGALISGASVPVVVSTTGPVTSLQLQVDGNNVGSPASASPLTLNTTALTNGQHTLTVVASDASNDRAPSPGVSVTVNNGGVAPTAFITGERSQSTLRNNYTGGVGMAINVGDKSLSVSSLGRLMATGNSGTHVLSLVQANGTPVPGGSATVNMAGGTVGQFVYAALTTPVTLAANTVYYVVSQEVSGGDKWYDLEPIITTTVAIVTGPTYTDGQGNYVIVGGYPGYSYVPLSFLYQ